MAELVSTNTPEYMRQWRADHPGHDAVGSRRRHLARMYNITPDQYEDLLAAQDGHCALCTTTPEQNGGVLCVDHDHDTGIVRGLLCDICNLRVPSTERLRAILAYVGW